MRPDITDVLRNSRLTLEAVIAPEVAAGYPRESLRAVIANLERLEASWDRVVPFLEWDNAATLALLERVELGDDFRARVRAATAPGGTRPFDAANAPNLQLRALLAEAIRRLPSDDPTARGAFDHLRERTRRYPIEWSWAPPAGE